MAIYQKIRIMEGGVPKTVDLAVSGTVLKAWQLQVADTAVAASKPMKLDASKKITSGDIDLESEVTGLLPYSHMNIADGDLTIEKVNGLQSAINGRIAASEKAQPNGVATLGPDGKLPSSQVPALAITETFVVSSQAAMLALDVQPGDVAVRTDISKTFILRLADATSLASWVEILNPAAPVQSVNGYTGNVTLTTNDVAESNGVEYFTVVRARDAVLVATITGSDVDHAPTSKAVYDALALKANDAAVVKSVNSKLPTAGAVVLNTDDLAEGTNKFYTATRARNDVLTSSVSNGITDKAPTSDAVHAIVSTKENKGEDTFEAVAGEAFAANTTYVVRYAVGGETARRVYKATSDQQNAANKYLAVGIIQTGATPITAGDPVLVYRYNQTITLKDNDVVIGSSTADQGAILWLNKDGGFGLSPSTGINVGDLYACFIVGVLQNYDSVAANQKVLIDISLSNLTGIDIL